MKMLGNGAIGTVNVIFTAQTRRKGENETETEWVNIADPRYTLSEAQHDVSDFISVHEKNEINWETRIVQIYEKVI
jgi:hypothetical protein